MEPRISIITLGVESLERSYGFHHEGLGFPTTKTPETGIIFFRTGGTCLALYPRSALAEDAGLPEDAAPGTFSGVTLAHVARSRQEVDDILALAERSGGSIQKPAQDVFWGGYSGYFAAPDGHLWEVAFADFWQFNEDGSLVID